MGIAGNYGFSSIVWRRYPDGDCFHALRPPKPWSKRSARIKKDPENLRSAAGTISGPHKWPDADYCYRPRPEMEAL